MPYNAAYTARTKNNRFVAHLNDRTDGTIIPLDKVSTRSMKGIIDKTLWCDENGVSQCTARLWIQTTSTGRLIGKTQSISISIEYV